MNKYSKHSFFKKSCGAKGASFASSLASKGGENTPWGDGTGPFGTGPVGRGLGPCRRGFRSRRFSGTGRPYFTGPQEMDDKEFLQQEKEILEKEIQMIEKRLKELEKKE